METEPGSSSQAGPALFSSHTKYSESHRGFPDGEKVCTKKEYPKEPHEVYRSGRVRHVRTTCPGLPWSVHGLKKTRRSPISANLFSSQ